MDLLTEDEVVRFGRSCLDRSGDRDDIAWALEDIADVLRRIDYLNRQLAVAVRWARLQGATWAAIGREFGVTYQAVQARFGSRTGQVGVGVRQRSHTGSVV